MFKTTFLLLVIRGTKTIVNLLINFIIGRMFGSGGIAHFTTVFAWQEFPPRRIVCPRNPAAEQISHCPAEQSPA